MPHDVVDAREGGAQRLQVLGKGCQFDGRPHERHQQRLERDQRTDRHLALHHLPAAIRQHDGRHEERRQERRERIEERRPRLERLHRHGNARIGGGDAREEVGLATRALDALDRRDAGRERSGGHADLALQHAGAVDQRPPRPEHDDEDRADGRHGHAGQVPVDEHHAHQESERSGKPDGRRRQARSQHVGHRLDAPQALRHVSRGSVREEPGRKPKQVLHEGCGPGDRHALLEHRKDPLLDPLHHRRHRHATQRNRRHGQQP